MKLLSTIKTALANVTDHLAAAAAHVPPVTPNLTIAPTGITITAVPSAPITLGPKPSAVCPHCGK